MVTDNVEKSIPFVSLEKNLGNLPDVKYLELKVLKKKTE